MLKYFMLFLLFTTPALAQTSPSPIEQAIGQKLFQEINAGLSCNSDLINTKAELAKANIKIKELEAKEQSK